MADQSSQKNSKFGQNCGFGPRRGNTTRR